MATTTGTPVPAAVTRRRPARSPASSARHRHRRVWNVVAVALAALWAFPLYWMLNSALMPADRLRSTPPLLAPLHPTFDAFRSVVHDTTFWRSMGFSLSVTLLAVAASVLGATLAAVTLSRFRFAGRTGAVLLVLVIQMIPAEALFVSQYRMLDGWHLLNSVVGLSMLYVGAMLPFTAWMLKGFVDQLPVELEEAAMVDGCSRVAAFFRVTFPLLGPGLVATGVFGFIVGWNEYTLGLVVLSSGDRMTLPVWLSTFSSNMNETNWAGVMAGSTLISVPVIVLFLLVQNAMTKGMAAGAVKG